MIPTSSPGLKYTDIPFKIFFLRCPRTPAGSEPSDRGSGEMMGGRGGGGGMYGVGCSFWSVVVDLVCGQRIKGGIEWSSYINPLHPIGNSLYAYMGIVEALMGIIGLTIYTQMTSRVVMTRFRSFYLFSHVFVLSLWCFKQWCRVPTMHTVDCMLVLTRLWSNVLHLHY